MTVTRAAAVALVMTVTAPLLTRAAELRKDGTPTEVEAGASVQSPACHVGRYRIVALPLRPIAINERGEVLGTTDYGRAAVWSGSSGLHELPLPTGYGHSEGVSINAQGHVAALAFDSGYTRSQGVFIAGDRVELLGGEAARPRHLNDNDEVVGEARVAGQARSAPVLWQAGTPGPGAGMVIEARPLVTCCGGTANGRDERGLVVGHAYDEQGRYYAFTWNEGGGLKRIDRSDRFSTAIALNHQGDVVIEAFPTILLYSSGALTRLPLASRPPAHPRALNDCRTIVGAVGPFSNKARAFAWDRQGGLADLNERIPEHSGWRLKSATGINDRGEIVGRGDPPGALDSGFLLLPDLGH